MQVFVRNFDLEKLKNLVFDLSQFRTEILVQENNLRFLKLSLVQDFIQV